MTQIIMKLIKTTLHAIEKIMLGIILQDREINTWIKEETKLIDAIESAKNLKWSHAGRIAHGDTI